MIPGKGSLEMVGGGEERWWNKMEVLAAQRLDKFYKCEMAKKPSSLFSVIIINVNIAHKHAHFLAIPVSVS